MTPSVSVKSRVITRLDDILEVVLRLIPFIRSALYVDKVDKAANCTTQRREKGGPDLLL